MTTLSNVCHDPDTSTYKLALLQVKCILPEILEPCGRAWTLKELSLEIIYFKIFHLLPRISDFTETIVLIKQQSRPVSINVTRTWFAPHSPLAQIDLYQDVIFFTPQNYFYISLCL